MKLIDIKPTIFENSTEDDFAEPDLSVNLQDQIVELRRKLKGNEQLALHLDQESGELSQKIPGTWLAWQQAPKGVHITNDLKSGKLVEFRGKYAPVNDQTEDAIQRVIEYETRRFKLYEINRKLRNKLSRLNKKAG
jgi:hypothetical protein